jgi:hypothetical protein
MPGELRPSPSFEASEILLHELLPLHILLIDRYYVRYFLIRLRK